MVLAPPALVQQQEAAALEAAAPALAASAAVVAAAVVAVRAQLTLSSPVQHGISIMVCCPQYSSQGRQRFHIITGGSGNAQKREGGISQCSTSSLNV